MSSYPATPAERDRFILARRPPRAEPDPWQAPRVHVDLEPGGDGRPERSAAILLTGRECPWRCAMCDLWRHTTTSDTPPGAIAAQLVAARRTLDAMAEPVTRLKLYNAGSFLDPRAVPIDDYDDILDVVGRTSLTVESHPSLVGPRLPALVEAMGRRAGPPSLEVAMGLETAHAEALDRLNKRMTPADFARAASVLAASGVGLRTFVLVSPPFVPAAEQDHWLQRTLEFAWACGARVVSLIPMRSGNGTMEALEGDGLFRRPSLADLERSLVLALGAPRPAGARVLADTWDLGAVASCAACLPARRARLVSMNLAQQSAAIDPCADCGVWPPA